MLAGTTGVRDKELLTVTLMSTSLIVGRFANEANPLTPFAEAMARLDTIPGVDVTTAQVIIAEVGLDMTRFPTAAHLASWAKFSPTISESAGKKSSGTYCPTPRPTSSTSALDFYDIRGGRG